jgi:hypothetical protein
MDSTTLLFCSHPEAEDLIVRPVTAAGAAELTLDVWGDACRGLDQGPVAGRWLSRIIGDPEAENPKRQIFEIPLFRESY